MFNLRGVLLPLDSQLFFQKLIGKITPVYFWKCYIMRIKISRCTAKFSGKWNVTKLLDLAFYSFYKNHYFFSQYRRRSRLAVGSGKHGNIFPIISKIMKLVLMIDNSRQIF